MLIYQRVLFWGGYIPNGRFDFTLCIRDVGEKTCKRSEKIWNVEGNSTAQTCADPIGSLILLESLDSKHAVLPCFVFSWLFYCVQFRNDIKPEAAVSTLVWARRYPQKLRMPGLTKWANSQRVFLNGDGIQVNEWMKDLVRARGFNLCVSCVSPVPFFP